MNKLVNISQAAEMLGVSTKILCLWDGEGKVEAVRTADFGVYEQSRCYNRMNGQWAE